MTAQYSYPKIMLLWLMLLVGACITACGGAAKTVKVSQPDGPYIMVVHGGAGTITRAAMTPEKEQAYRAKLTEAVKAGFDVLRKGGKSLDAVTATIRVLEDSPLFNAGKGAVFTHDGKNEMDAAIMDGSNGNAGAVAGVGTIKNPILAARAVMEQSEHVMLSGRGAEAFARQAGLQIVDPSYFYTQNRYDALQKVLRTDSTIVKSPKKSLLMGTQNTDHKFGTVGCVALDRQGNLAAGTSTGGMTNKKYGRIGDSPIIGAGTYANRQVGISCTGWGEYFIRNVAAYDVAALMAYKDWSVEQAAEEVIMKKIPQMGGDGGLIALDSRGHVAMPFNTAGMYRATLRKDGTIAVKIYKDE